MSCGAECLMDMLEFNGKDRFRGSPGCCGNAKLGPSYSDPAIYGGSNISARYDSSSDKYSIGLSKKGYGVNVETNYFEAPTNAKNYSLAITYKPIYENVMPKKIAIKDSNTEIKGIANEIDTLEAMINAARQKESLAWTQ